ncbi:hypothetical protein GGGNBK_06160 [Sporosarcina sp. ANT_H38]
MHRVGQESPSHIAGHKAKLGKSKPDYIFSSEGGLHEVEAVKCVTEAV